jgi:hypothetical protein
MSATSEGTSAAPAAPATPCAAIITVAFGLNVISTIATPKIRTTARNTRSAPNRWHNFAPSMTRPATASEYMTIPVATVVGGTLKSATIPPMATGREATLNDISTWPSAMATIGSQDSCASDSRPRADTDCVVMAFSPGASC